MPARKLVTAASPKLRTVWEKTVLVSSTEAGTPELVTCDVKVGPPRPEQGP